MISPLADITNCVHKTSSEGWVVTYWGDMLQSHKPSLDRQRQEAYEFEASLGYIAKISLQNTKGSGISSGTKVLPYMSKVLGLSPKAGKGWAADC